MWKLETENEPVSIFLWGRKRLDYEQKLEKSLQIVIENYILSILIKKENLLSFKTCF